MSEATVTPETETPEVVKVVFRRFRDDGAVIALFPEVPSDIFGYECSSYMHVGQHGPAHVRGVVANSKPGYLSDPDVMALFTELETLGYRLDPRVRVTYQMDRARFAEADRLRKELETQGAGHVPHYVV